MTVNKYLFGSVNVVVIIVALGPDQKLSFRYDGIKRLLPVPRLYPFQQDLKHLVHCEDLACWERSEVAAYWEAR